jgi:hypothetical protein
METVKKNVKMFISLMVIHVVTSNKQKGHNDHTSTAILIIQK